MKSRRTRRSGATQTIGISLAPRTKLKLKELAAERHHGNVSALITEMTEDASRHAAFERAWRWYGGPELSGETRERLDAEFDEGWTLARKKAAVRAKRHKSRA